ncbi:calcyphosin isoform X2 [Pteropus medius]|nr:calcyphosin isoform X2 [Pteropus giganteus]XP_039734420.1 calcyphosin isoform X2 [Pteropus giganteus]
MDAVDATVEKLRAQCLSRGASGIQGLARFFRRLDRDRSLSLDAGELQRGLAELGMVLDMAEAEGVCRRWDRDGNGVLDLEEFLRALRVGLLTVGEPLHPAAWGVLGSRGLTCQHGDTGPSSLRGACLGVPCTLRSTPGRAGAPVTTPPLLQPPMSQAREAIIAAAFAKLDRSGDGVVTVGDLRGVYSGRTHPKVQSGQWTEEEVLRRFLDNFDSSQDGQVGPRGVHPSLLPGLWSPLRARLPPGHAGRIPGLLQWRERLRGLG